MVLHIIQYPAVWLIMVCRNQKVGLSATLVLTNVRTPNPQSRIWRFWGLTRAGSCFEGGEFPQVKGSSRIYRPGSLSCEDSRHADWPHSPTGRRIYVTDKTRAETRWRLEAATGVGGREGREGDLGQRKNHSRAQHCGVFSGLLKRSLACQGRASTRSMKL